MTNELIGPNALEVIAKQRPDEFFLKGSGVLKLLQGIRTLERELQAANERAERSERDKALWKQSTENMAEQFKVAKELHQAEKERAERAEALANERDIALHEAWRIGGENGARADSLAAEKEELAGQVAMLRDELQSARDSIEDWGAYAMEYFQNKWNLKGDIAKADAALAATSSEKWLAGKIADAQAWQPIETAPKSTYVDTEYGADVSGKYLLGFCPEPDMCNLEVAIRIIWWEPLMNGGKGMWYGEGSYGVHPTHWQPLPPPPVWHYY